MQRPLRFEHVDDGGAHHWQIFDADGLFVAECFDQETAAALCETDVHQQAEQVLYTPTYLGQEGRDYGDDSHPVYVYSECGARLCLGGPREDNDRPDLLVEKTAGGWRVFIHPANCDPDYVYVIELRADLTRVEDAAGNLIHETAHDWR